MLRFHSIKELDAIGRRWTHSEVWYCTCSGILSEAFLYCTKQSIYSLRHALQSRTHTNTPSFEMHLTCSSQLRGHEASALFAGSYTVFPCFTQRSMLYCRLSPYFCPQYIHADKRAVYFSTDTMVRLRSSDGLEVEVGAYSSYISPHGHVLILELQRRWSPINLV
jgi:hypothetical protein